MVNGEKIELDCIVYATGFEAEATPLFRRAGHDIVGVDGVTLAELWADGASSLYGMMVRGLPNLFTMPAPSQQSVVTVNYTQLAVLGAEIVAQTIAQLLKKGGPAFEVTAEAEHDWNQKILASFADASALMSACTPSRINNEGHPESRNPLNGNYGRGFGDYFGYRDLLKTWVASEQFDGLELR
jgi:cyclohexanone monooxygenase/pentalenolactone D synthase